MSNKFRHEDRTFLTRLEFIKSIFSNKFDKDKILKSGIQHKLNVSLGQFTHDAEMEVYWATFEEKPISAFKKL